MNTRYILILFMVSLTPLLLRLTFPGELVFQAQSIPSSFNQDTKENNQFTILVKTQSLPPPGLHLYVDVYQFKPYLFLGKKITWLKFVKKTLSGNTGVIVISPLDSGKYLILPRSLPLQPKLIGQYWVIEVADHDPVPLTLQL